MPKRAPTTLAPRQGASLQAASGEASNGRCWSVDEKKRLAQRSKLSAGSNRVGCSPCEVPRIGIGPCTSPCAT